MNLIADDILMHYGVKRRSGRYPWGSGENPYQHGSDFLARVEELKAMGKTEKEVAAELGMSTTDLRMQERVAKHERRALQVARAQALREDGKTLDEIAKIMGYNNDSSVRALLNKNTATNKNKAEQTADVLRKELAEKGAIDVSTGAEQVLGVTAGVLEEALFILETEGYNRYGVGVPNVTVSGKQTNTKVISIPEIDQGHFYQPADKENGIKGGTVNLDEIKSIGEYHTTDGGLSWDKREYPASINSDRVKILYGDEGGKNKDGVIEIRRGVKDLDLGDSHYAQVRIAVDDTHYLKGMAMYGDDKDFPPGCDIIFNTNKPSGTPKEKVMKELKDDPDNPFGAYIKANGQSYYSDPNGKYTDPVTGEKMSLSAINKLKEEGDWDKMSRNLSSQFLSKQPVRLIQNQLNLTYSDAQDEFSEIKSLTIPTVRKKLLMDFAEECDSAVVHIKAAALPRQSTQVILPVTQMSPTEIYAPNYRDGEKVALIRYPHGGTFEIPILTVNNKNESARKILGTNITDAVGIHPEVAERLSGADFDGDQVVVIPTGGKVKITSTPALDGLKGFDPKTEYSTEGKEGVKLLSEGQKQMKMGEVSNLITDMTLKGATEAEIAKAVRHSMVIIDAVKHKLDYKQSELDNDIATLKKRWQAHVVDEDGRESYGASTLISRHKQDVKVPERRGSAHVNKETGELVYKESGRTYVNDKGQTVQATTSVKLLNNVDDAYEISSGTAQEDLYADYINKMKALANEARREYANTPTLARSASAAKTYQPEVDRLTSALRTARLNAPREREAQRIANTIAKAKIEDNNVTDKDEISKIKRIAINDARLQTGANGKGTRINISDGEWEAIKAGAISDTMLQEILRYADPDVVRERATPRTRTEISPARQTRIQNMANSGYTNQEIADQMNVSPSTVSKILKGTY